MPLWPIKWRPLKFCCEITQKSSFNGQYSWRRRIISSNWNPLKNHEKYFLFHLNKLNILLANQILHILCIFIKPNVWYSWSLKILAIKRWFPFNFAKILQCRHFLVGGPKNFFSDIFLRAAFKILYCRVYCYFCVLAIKLI